MVEKDIDISDLFGHQLNVIVAPVTPQNRRWRTLLRVIDVHEHDGVFVVIPGWNSRIAVLIPWDQVALAIRPKVRVGVRCYGNVCLGAESWEDLVPFINEVPPQYTDAELAEDGLDPVPMNNSH